MINYFKISIICFFTLIAVKSNAQENLTFSKVIQTDSVGKTKIFTTINDWFATTYKSASDVIQMSDKEAGIIIGNGSMSYGFGKLAYSCYDGYIKYTIKIYVKDNKYKVELTNFMHSGNGPQCNLGIITTSDVYTSSGMSKNAHNKVWEDIKLKIEQNSNDIFISLENKTKIMKSGNDGSDF